MTTDFFSPSFIEASLTVIHHDKSPFYASDLDLNGGQISALSGHGFIKPTGKTKAYYLDLDDGYARRVTVKEWKVNVKRMNDFFTNTLPAQIEQLQTLLNVTQDALNA
jgi:hypothetical protein